MSDVAFLRRYCTLNRNMMSLTPKFFVDPSHLSYRLQIVDYRSMEKSTSTEKMEIIYSDSLHSSF